MDTKKFTNFTSFLIYLSPYTRNFTEFWNNLKDNIIKYFDKYEIMLVNDGVNENTMNSIKDEVKAFKEYQSISIVNMGDCQGVEKSMSAAIDLSIGDYIVTCDQLLDDFDPQFFINAFNLAISDSDIVNIVPSKRFSLSSDIYYKIFNKFSDMPYKIDTYIMQIFSRRTINRIKDSHRAIYYRKAAFASANLKQISLKYPISKKDSLEIISNEKDQYNFAIDTFVLYTETTFKVSIFMAVLMAAATFGIIIYTLITYLSQNPVPGFTPIMFVMSGSFCILFILISFILKYNSIILKLMLSKSNYSIRSVEKL